MERKGMGKVLIAAVLMGMASGAYAAGETETTLSGEQFRRLGVSASELRGVFPMENAAAEPARVGIREQIESNPPSAAEQTQTRPEKVEFGFISDAERKEYIAKASMWAPEESLNVGAIDFKSGPFNPLKYQPEELVTCRYIPMAEAYDGGKPNGKTPKFKCEDPKGKKLKVKYGKDNGEVLTEVAASWILTSIGAYADKMYPVRLACPDCPSDPFVSEADRGSWPAGSKVAIEDKVGARIEATASSGIGFDEFHLIQDRVGAEALTGLVHFFGNSDNKAANQAIACLEKDVVKDQAGGRAKCLKPIVYLQDMGISFGGRGLYHNSRMNYEKWAAEKIWDDPAKCVLRLNTAPTSTVIAFDSSGRNLHQVGEQARQMMVHRLSLLSRAQLVDIFTAARAPDREPKHTAEEWADLFIKKVKDLAEPMGKSGNGDFSCPHSVVPENSSQPPSPAPAPY
jgi:hypothetical protein